MNVFQLFRLFQAILSLRNTATMSSINSLLMLDIVHLPRSTENEYSYQTMLIRHLWTGYTPRHYCEGGNPCMH